MKILPRELRELEQSRDYSRRWDPHKLLAVDATSFVIKRRARIGRSFTFDHLFSVVGLWLGG